MAHYPDVKVSPNFAELEESILKRWQEQKIFEASVAKNPKIKDGKSNEFVFYDGPPFANGLPHYGHIVTSYVKDIIPRYQTMKGKHVDRRQGWDCHGLPAELAVEKELGINGAKEIAKYGIGRFNEACQSSVMRFTQDWQWYFNRMGRWVSRDDQYRTMDLPYMESVMWAFKQLWDKGLVYEGYRVVAYSWAAQSPVSNSETKLDNSYRERTDPTLTVGFQLQENALSDKPVKVLAWTTTPWTLVSNMALCVNPEFTYQLIAKGDVQYIIAANARTRYERELDGFEVVRELTGAELVGLQYEPLFPFFAKLAGEGAFRVISGEFVDAESGTGIVHIAPGFGEDDMEVGKKFGVPIVVPVDDAGRFTAEVPEYEGLNVILEANERIIKDLKARGGVVVKHDQILHSYPHCWRTDQPLIYRAMDSWYVAVSKFRDRMVELNQGITWVPGHIKDGQFHNWLSNARDWNISRNRFWGAPIPVWKSDNPAYPRVDVYGSIEELERDFGVKVTDLHRPAIDNLVRANPDDPTGKSMMRRVPEVLDCWFESGSMPFAQLHYPFENRQRFEENFPGDFIVEYVAQVRGWFYNMMVLSTALFDRAPFKSCICHGVVLDVNNQKLSKRLKNYPDPVDVFKNLGSDALRWYMLSSPLMVGGDLSISEDDTDIAKSMRAVIIRLWNAYYFFTLYANTDGIKAKLRTDSTHPLDQYLLGKTAELVQAIESNLDVLNIPAAYDAAPAYIEAINNWYIRNRRAAFWSDGASEDKQAAYDTLYTSLVYASRALAPMMPYLAEQIHTALTGEPSVHLANWPRVADLPLNRDVLDGMDLAREACSAVLRLRELHRRRVRLPLKKLVIAHPQIERLRPYIDLIKEAVNIVEIELAADPGAYGTRAVKVNPKLGAKLGAKFKDVLAAQRSNSWTMTAAGELDIAGITLPREDFELRIVVKDDAPSDSFDRWQGLVLLDITVYPELEIEGWSRDLVRIIQQTRKDRNLNITDRIEVKVQMPAEMSSALQPFVAHISKETLAASLTFLQDNLPDGAVQDEIGEAPIRLDIARIG